MDKELLKQLMANMGKQAVSGVGKALITPDALQDVAEKSVDSAATEVVEAPKKTSFLKRLGTAAGGLLGKVAPIAASFIPGIGPIASKVLSTLNDDEWFGEYKAAGATFNELLTVQLRDSADTQPMYDLVGAVGFLRVDILTASYWQDQVLPSILSYVRDKTENVLNATEQQYWDAFVNASKLYAIYFNLLKYKTLAQNLPLNIPRLTSLITTADPTNYSMLSGVIDSLKGYLQSTIALPYAWVEYLRWRFGTAFKSSNTGKPGLILYEYISASDDPATIEANVIDVLKSNLVACGRAVADLNLAYKDHQLRFDVEESHYDEKEFCLRCNFWSNIQGHFGTAKAAGVYMDSRLDSSAALQAITLSTSGYSAIAPFHIGEIRIAWYIQDAVNFPWYDNVQGSQEYMAFPAGWYMAPIETWGHGYRMFTVQTGTKYDTSVLSERTYAAQYNTSTESARAAILKLLANYAADTLEFHNLAAGFSVTDNGQIIKFYVRGKSLAFDTAYITNTQVSAIHRMALRNLTRGTYKRKVPISTDPTIKTEVANVVDAVKDEMKKDL